MIEFLKNEDFSVVVIVLNYASKRMRSGNFSLFDLLSVEFSSKIYSGLF